MQSSSASGRQPAVVAHRLLRDQGHIIGLRTVQRAVAPVRIETAPGAQMQVDFGEKRVPIAGVAVKVVLLVATLASRRASELFQPAEPGSHLIHSRESGSLLSRRRHRSLP